MEFWTELTEAAFLMCDFQSYKSVTVIITIYDFKALN
jgi:hypothetical protein